MNIIDRIIEKQKTNNFLGIPLSYFDNAVEKRDINEIINLVHLASARFMQQERGVSLPDFDLFYDEIMGTSRR